MEALNQQLGRLPIMLLIILYCGWLGYDYYDWLNAPSSELGQKKAALSNAKAELESLKKKLAAGEEFYQNLDTLRARILQLNAQLEATKTNLSADVDIANFVRMLTLEASKLKITLKGIKPDPERKKDYYIEVPFTLHLRGAYVQLLVFFDRIAKFQQVVRVSEFEMKPTSNVFTKYVELEGTAKLVAYKYLGTGADEIRQKEEMQGNEKLDKAAEKAEAREKK